MDARTLIQIHVVISVIGIVTGFIVLFGMLANRRMNGWNAVFLATTILTSATGFILPAEKFLPSHAIGILSLILLAIAVVARYPKQMLGSWRWIYVVTALLSQYFNVFVLVAQAFLNVPALKAAAPTQTEPPFAIAQGVVLLIFIGLITAAVRKFRPA